MEGIRFQSKILGQVESFLQGQNRKSDVLGSSVASHASYCELADSCDPEKEYAMYLPTFSYELKWGQVKNLIDFVMLFQGQPQQDLHKKIIDCKVYGEDN